MDVLASIPSPASTHEAPHVIADEENIVKVQPPLTFFL
jgi:hypothetical protein